MYECDGKVIFSSGWRADWTSGEPIELVKNGEEKRRQGRLEQEIVVVMQKERKIVREKR